MPSKSPSAIALTIASLLTKPGGQDLMGDDIRSDCLYDTVCLLCITDEQKAELYAFIEEGLTAKTPYNEAVRIIETALNKVMP